MLELRSIAKQLGETRISDITFDIADGQYFVLLGPSGEGKTVLLEIIAGLTKPDEGNILWNSQDITFAAPHSRGFGVVYQDYALFPHLTVAQNIAYGLHAAGCSADHIKKKQHQLSEVFGIGDLLTRYPTNLSGGEQQRVALARALAIEPKLLLLDEPLSSLDKNVRLKLRNELKHINKTLNVSVLHVTHDTEEAMVLGDQICVMLDNTVRLISSPDELFRTPSDHKVAKFLGMKNVLPVQSVTANICSVFGAEIHASDANESTSHIWVKPEEIIISKKPFDSSARNQFKCTVTGWDYQNSLLAVKVRSGQLKLTTLITHSSFEKLKIETDTKAYITFKSSAVHCF